MPVPAGATPESVSAAHTGLASDLEIPAGRARIVSLDRETSYFLTARASLPDATYLLECAPPRSGPRHGDRDSPWMAVRFDGQATVRPADGTVDLLLPERRPLSITVAEDSRPASVTVPRTPEGLATALTYSDAGIDVTGPERALPSARPHPPRIELGSRSSVPAATRRNSADTGLELHLPRSLAAGFVAAPLVYYLGAEVTVGEVRDPRLCAPRTGLDHGFDGDEFAREVRRTLRRTVYLDALVHERRRESARGRHGSLAIERTERVTDERTERVTVERTEDLSRGERSGRSVWPDGVGGHRRGVDRESRFDGESTRGSDPVGGVEDVGERPLDERVTAYLDLPQPWVDTAVPEWHETTATRADPDRIPCLPHLFDSLSAIELASRGSGG